MKKVISKIIKATQILLLITMVLFLQKVNLSDSNNKISNSNINKTLDLTAMSVKLNQIQLADKYYPLDTFTGDLTGYGANCALCSGFLGCTGMDVRDGTTEYNDADYGTVHIVASSKNLKCGSIIQFDAPHLSDKKITAIVLDRGVLGNDIDYLSPSEEYANEHVGRRKITYDVLRFGWKRQEA